MEIVRFGNLYLDNEPVEGGVFVPYTVNQDIRLGDTAPKAHPIDWVKVHDSLYVSRNILLTNISWRDLDEQGFVYGREVTIDGRKYNARLLQMGTISNDFNEWEAILGAAPVSVSLFCMKMSFIGIDLTDFSVVGEQRCSVRGAYTGLASIDTTAERPTVGWRPVLEPLDMQLALDTGCIGLPLSIRCPFSVIQGKLVEITSYDLILDTTTRPVIDLEDSHRAYYRLSNGQIAVDRGQITGVWENI